MKKTLLIAGALLAMTASIASAAGGINLSWTDCGLFGLASKTSACTSNTGASILYGSAIAPVPMGRLNGETSVVDLQTTQAATLSNWWQMGAGGCRSTALSGNFNFSAGPFNCYDVWAGQASGGINYAPSGNRARLKTTAAVALETATDDVTEMYIWAVTMTMTKTTGTGSCTGCLDGACFVFNEQLLTQPLGVGDYKITNPINRQHVTWQASGGTVVGPPPGCPAATPTKNSTWGSVKSLYR